MISLLWNTKSELNLRNISGYRERYMALPYALSSSTQRWLGRAIDGYPAAILWLPCFVFRPPIIVLAAKDPLEMGTIDNGS